MDIKEHRDEFLRIIEKYGLQEEEKAEEIAEFLTKRTSDGISVKEFATLFAMDDRDAMIFLSFITKGIKFKEENLDKK